MVVDQLRTASIGTAAGLEASGDVEVRGVAKTFGTVEALKPTSFHVPRGRFITLLGPSGSGKTTLLKLIAGFEEPSAGTVLISGRDVTDVPAHRRNVGFVFQQYALFPHLTVAQNIAYPLEMRRLPRTEIRKAVTDTLDLVRLPGLADRKPSELSGGQQQRVALARAIVFRPPVLLMDEPMAALDKRLREEMQFEIRTLQRKLGITTIAVTHDQSEALVMSDVILVLREGQLQQAGSPEDLYHDPANEFVASFVGESNILRGRVRGSGVVVSEGLELPVASTPPASGAEVICVLRPEVIEIGGTNGRVFATRAEIIERIFCGEVVRLRVRLATAPEITLVAKMRASRSQAIPDVGASVQASWQPEDMTIIMPGAK